MGPTWAFVTDLPARNTATVVKTCPGAADGSKWPLEPLPGAAAGSKWPLELAPEPPNASKSAAQAWPRAAKCSRSAAPACPGAAECSKSAARACSGAFFEPAPEPQQARKMPLEPTAVRCVRFFRSISAVSCSSVIGINFCSAPLCSVGFGLAGRSNWPLEPARPRWGARPDRA